MVLLSFENEYEFPGIADQRLKKEKSIKEENSTGKAIEHEVFGNLYPAFAEPRVTGVLGHVRIGKQIT